MFASRTALLGLALVIAAARGQAKALAWVLFADTALQVFDSGLALALHKSALAILPAAIGGLEVWAGIALLRSGGAAAAPPPAR
jgi:hypothetical protein